MEQLNQRVAQYESDAATDEEVERWLRGEEELAEEGVSWVREKREAAEDVQVLAQAMAELKARIADLPPMSDKELMERWERGELMEESQI
jgi:hypothetical protein